MKASDLPGPVPIYIGQEAGRGGEMGEVPDGDLIIELGKARIAHDGDDVTMVAIGPMVRPAVRAVRKLAKEAIGVEQDAEAMP